MAVTRKLCAMRNSRRDHVELQLDWCSSDASHCEQLFIPRGPVSPGLGGASVFTGSSSPGSDPQCSLDALGLIPDWDPHSVVHLERSGNEPGIGPNGVFTPQRGRFYPRRWFRELADAISPAAHPAVRLMAVSADSLMFNLNHPLAGRQVTLTVSTAESAAEAAEWAGHAALGALLVSGPGLQAAVSEGQTDFYDADGFGRQDTEDDAVFYAAPRLVQHLDATARALITGVYERFLQPGDRVLDLMSSWVSHLPEALDLRVSGLGMNAHELSRNHQLADFKVQDLNRQPTIAYPEASFDAVTCTVSVEYLIDPLAVFREVLRVLKPGGVFLCSFSDRWFPSKSIRLWELLHPFERMGLVLDYYRRSRGFAELSTQSIRGLPRPPDDPYAQRRAEADPVFVVSGRRVGN